MAPLDPERVRIFAAAHGAADLDALLDQIERANLWRFARRPLDLDWLVRYWRAHGRLGTLAEMLESSLNERITETNPDRVRADRLNAERARHALQRVGSALVFGRKATIAIPDSELLRPDDLQPLDLAQVLPDWSADDRLRLLSRPVFDPPSGGHGCITTTKKSSADTSLRNGSIVCAKTTCHATSCSISCLRLPTRSISSSRPCRRRRPG
jgi:hypothetical protein